MILEHKNQVNFVIGQKAKSWFFYSQTTNCAVVYANIAHVDLALEGFVFFAVVRYSRLKHLENSHEQIADFPYSVGPSQIDTDTKFPIGHIWNFPTAFPPKQWRTERAFPRENKTNLKVLKLFIFTYTYTNLQKLVTNLGNKND